MVNNPTIHCGFGCVLLQTDTFKEFTVCCVMSKVEQHQIVLAIIELKVFFTTLKTQLGFTSSSQLMSRCHTGSVGTLCL